MATILEIGERLHGADLGPDVAGRVIAWGVDDFWETFAPRAVLRRRVAGVYQVHSVAGSDLTALETQASAVYTLAEWLSDAGRRATWDGLDVDASTVAGSFYPGELGAQAEATNPNVILDEQQRLVTTDAGEPVEA